MLAICPSEPTAYIGLLLETFEENLVCQALIPAAKLSLWWNHHPAVVTTTPDGGLPGALIGSNYMLRLLCSSFNPSSALSRVRMIKQTSLLVTACRSLHSGSFHRTLQQENLGTRHRCVYFWCKTGLFGGSDHHYTTTMLYSGNAVFGYLQIQHSLRRVLSAETVKLSSSFISKRIELVLLLTSMF